MFPPERLGKLNPAHRLRKAALMLTECERTILQDGGGAGSPPPTDSERPGAPAGSRGTSVAFARALGIARALAAFAETPPAIRDLALAFGSDGGSGDLRALDALRHALFQVAGQDRADWDLIDPGSGGGGARRSPYPGVRAWLEDIRSPFNVGSMLRSAEAFGLEELILSPGSADPDHPRACRSAMGAVAILPWRRGDLQVLDQCGPAFALELGGTPLDEFTFPDQGIVVLGSEELGVSRQALDRCSLGRVSIPMRGAKASLNVGVAFGVLLSAWTASLRRSKGDSAPSPARG